MYLPSKKKIFGNDGVAWLWPFKIYWKCHPEVERVKLNEFIHIHFQYLEVWSLFVLPVIGLCALLDYPIWWIAPALYITYHITYGLIALVTKLRGRHPYFDHPMEIDSRMYDDKDMLYGRPPFAWFRYF